MNINEVLKVLDVLIGEVEPIGDSYEDDKRLENTKVLVGVMYAVVGKVSELTAYSKYDANSMKKVGDYALDNLITMLKTECDWYDQCSDWCDYD